MIACISADALLCNNLLSTALIGLFTLMTFLMMSNKSTDINKYVGGRMLCYGSFNIVT